MHLNIICSFYYKLERITNNFTHRVKKYEYKFNFSITLLEYIKQIGGLEILESG